MIAKVLGEGERILLKGGGEERDLLLWPLIDCDRDLERERERDLRISAGERERERDLDLDREIERDLERECLRLL